MKKLTILLLSGVVIAGTFSSCQKCTVCTAPTIAGDEVTEYCGTELDVRDFEKYFIDSLAGESIVGYCERGPEE